MIKLLGGVTIRAWPKVRNVERNEERRKKKKLKRKSIECKGW